MKKVVVLLTCSLLIGFFIGWNIDIGTDEEKDFLIFQSYINTGGNYKDTYLKVIVYKKDFGEAKMFEQIKDFHAKMNGISNELTIVLYRSKEDLLNDEQIAEQTFFNE